MRFSGNQQHAGLSEFFQFRIPNPDRGGKLLAVGGSMIALVERGREMPFPNPGFHGKSRAAKPPFLPAGTQGRKRRFLRQQRARFSKVGFWTEGGYLLP